MEFLVIGDTKLKVTLTSEECAQYNIDTMATDFSGGEIRTVVRAILALAESECGFCAEGERILAQLYPLPDGSCELLVTKLGASAKDKRLVRDTEGLGAFEDRRRVYRFPSLEVLRLAERAILPRAEYEAYLADSGECYISVLEALTDGISELEALIEYGERIDSIPPHVVAERGRRLDPP